MTSWGDPEAYAASFGPLCAATVDDLLAACGPVAAGGFLDAGCGTGAVAERACSASWGTVGVDADPAMVAAARTRVPGVGFVVGELPRLPFAGGTFAAVGANFVVNHTADPRAATAELVRVCRPGGRVALTIWPERLITVNRLWNDVMLAAGVEPPPRKGLAPGLDVERTPAGLAALAAGAGLREVQVRELELVLRVAPADLWRAAEGGIATIGAVYRARDTAGRSRMREAYDTLTATMVEDGLLVLPATALLAAGTM